jgi:hypothetical protein
MTVALPIGEVTHDGGRDSVVTALSIGLSGIMFSFIGIGDASGKLLEVPIGYIPCRILARSLAAIQ